MVEDRVVGKLLQPVVVGIGALSAAPRAHTVHDAERDRGRTGEDRDPRAISCLGLTSADHGSRLAPDAAKHERW